MKIELTPDEINNFNYFYGYLVAEREKTSMQFFKNQVDIFEKTIQKINKENLK